MSIEKKLRRSSMKEWFIMTISNLLKLCSYQDVEKELKLHYSYVDTKKFSKLYLHLTKMSVKKPINKNLYLCITARRIQNDGIDPAVDVFDEGDKDIYFDVSGFEKGTEILYSVSSLSYEEFLQYSIDEETLEKFTPESILAHALWEITSYGFEDKNS